MDFTPTLKPFLAISMDKLHVLIDNFERGHLDLTFDPQMQQFDTRQEAERYCLFAGPNQVGDRP